MYLHTCIHYIIIGVNGVNKQLKQCAGCRVVYYCCHEHQKLDWKRHKPICKRVQAKK